MMSLHSGLKKLLIDVCTAQHLSGNLFPDAKENQMHSKYIFCTGS